MSFLTPLFLLGALLLAIPFWLHRLQAQSSERKKFSSAMLLETAQQQVHVRRKLKYLILLALRTALLALLVLAFAKPFLTVAPEAIIATEAGTRVVLVDVSASMDRAGVFTQAKTAAQRAIDSAPDDALLQLVAVSDTLELVGGLSNQKSGLRAQIAGLSVGPLHVDYGETMTAMERLASSFPPPVAVHFVSDYQSSALPVRFSDLIPAGVTDFVPHVVGSGTPFNWSVEYVRETADGIDVGVNGVGDRERVADIDIELNGVTLETQSISVTGPQILRFEIPQLEAGENRIVVNLSTDDDLQVDNRWYHVVDNDPPATIPVITLNSGGLPLTYLSAALESTGDYAVEVLLAGDFDARILGRYPWVVIDDIGLLDPVLESSLIQYLQDGGNVLVFTGDRARALEVLPLTAHRQSANSVRTEADAFLTVGQVDLRHPALAQTEGWQSVNVTQNFALEAIDGDEVLIRLDNNEPFLIEQSAGVGRILLMTGSLDNRWNDLPIRPVFVSFIVETARYLSGINDIPKIYTSGAILPLALTGNTSGQVVDPDGNTILSLADTTREQQVKLQQPGFYEVFTPQGQTIVAANIDPLESDLRRLTQDVLDRWQDTTGGQEQGDAVSFSAEETKTVELWHWILLFLAIVAIAESVLGNSYLTARQA